MSLEQQKELFKIIRQSERQDIDLQSKYKDVFNFIDHNFKARHEPEPPTVRPMSELPEGNQRFSILVLHTIYDAKVWDVGFLVRENEVSDGFRIFKLKDKEFKSESGIYKIIGWLPLPNSDDIKI